MIVTEFVYPPIPVRHFDWMAYIEGDAGDGPTGRGETEVEALRDLCEQLAEHWLDRPDISDLVNRAHEISEGMER